MIPFVKMQGLGNDFVVLDALRDLPAFDASELAQRMCDRRLGVGGDGILLLEKGEAAPLRMRMWNPDGSESEMCGNGLRCVAALARDRQYASGSVDFETGAGVLHASYLADLVSIDMGTARLDCASIGMTGPGEAQFVQADLGDGTVATAVSMGNPHLVVFSDEIESIPLAERGSELERHPLFPNRINVHFSKVVSRSEVRVRVWERGAGATLACGTGACSVAVAGVVTGQLDERSMIWLPGGPLTIDVTSDLHVTMTGPAVTVFEGTWDR